MVGRIKEIKHRGKGEKERGNGRTNEKEQNNMVIGAYGRTN